jgi:cobalt-zinc-cadmium efflux system outer membrane protein
LEDPGLRQFLRENLGHDVTAWDSESLCWVGFYYQPSLELARAQWTTARAAQQTAAQRPNPSLTLTPGYDFTKQAGVSPWMPAVNLDLPLTMGNKRARQQEIARFDAEAARLAVFTAAWQMRSDLRKALADASSSTRRGEVLRRQAEVQQRLLQLLEQRFNVGAAAAADVSTSRSAWLRAEAAAADAASQAATARTRVAAALGIPVAALDGVALPPPSSAPVLSGGELAAARRQALQSRADVLAALAKYESAQAALELELAKRIPDVHLGPGYQYDQGLNKWSLGITFELPVFNQNQGPIAEAVARRGEAVAQFNVIQNQAIAAIDTAIAELTAASAQLQHARELQSEVRKQAAFAQQRLEQGSADQVEVQSAQLDVATAESTLVDAENAYAVASGDLEAALQVPFPNLAALADPGRTNKR